MLPEQCSIRATPTHLIEWLQNPETRKEFFQMIKNSNVPPEFHLAYDSVYSRMSLEEKSDRMVDNMIAKRLFRHQEFESVRLASFCLNYAITFSMLKYWLPLHLVSETLNQEKQINSQLLQSRLATELEIEEADLVNHLRVLGHQSLGKWLEALESGRLLQYPQELQYLEQEYLRTALLSLDHILKLKEQTSPSPRKPRQNVLINKLCELGNKMKELWSEPSAYEELIKAENLVEDYFSQPRNRSDILLLAQQSK